MLEQKRAALAFEQVKGLDLTDSEKKRYGVMALKLTALIRTAGLCQAIYFIKSRNKKPYDRLLEHLAAQLKRLNRDIRDADALCDKVRQANIQQYLLLTREALAAANWYGRLAQSELGIKSTDDEESANVAR